MNDKQEILTMLKEEFQRWVELPSGMSEADVTARRLPAGLSIKDLYAHLMAWQQRSVARMEAAVEGCDPRFPAWPENLDPDGEGEQMEAINAWIHGTYLDHPWDQVYQNWHSGFARMIELAEKVPEQDLIVPGRYSWLPDYPLSLVLESSYQHHHEEHYKPLVIWLNRGGG